MRFRALLGQRVPDEFLDAKLGQVALEEGELLALRLPEQAMSILELASECFVAAGDNFGAFVAELRLAIAEIHAGARRHETKDRHEEIVLRYEALRVERGSLPAVGPLSARDPKVLIEPDDPLRGWVWRLAFYLQWYEGNRVGPQAQATAMEFGSEFALRPAFGFVRPSLARRGDGSRQRFAARSPSLYRWLPVVSGSILLALGLGLALRVGLALEAVLAVVALALAAVVAPFLIEGVGPRLPRRVLPLSGFDLSLISLSTIGQGPALQAFGLLEVRARARHRVLRVYLSRLRNRRQFSYSMISTGVTRERIAKVPESVHQALRPRLLGGHVPLRLEVASDLAWAPWERILLAEPVSDPDWNPDHSPRITRVRPRGFPSPQPDWGGDIAAVCAPRWRQFVEGGAHREVRWLPELSTLGPMQPAGSLLAPEDGEGPSRAVIAQGTAVETKAGWRLRLDEDRLSEPLQDPSEPGMQQLLRPDLLARRFPIVVLVGPPGGESLTADRQSSDNLRGLANEIFLAGAYAVITLPVLPSAVGAKAIEALVNQFSYWESLPDEEELGRCVQSLRSSVYRLTRFTDKQARRMRRVDLALDVCLFAPRPMKGR